MKVTISKSFHFDAAHWLPHVPEGHKCKRLHGHTYRVELVCAGDVDPGLGWLIDYGDIAEAWSTVVDRLDHRCLNHEPGLENPTTEVLCHWLLARLRPLLATLRAVRVYESSTTWCEAEAEA